MWYTGTLPRQVFFQYEEAFGSKSSSAARPKKSSVSYCRRLMELRMKKLLCPKIEEELLITATVVTRGGKQAGDREVKVKVSSVTESAVLYPKLNENGGEDGDRSNIILLDGLADAERERQNKQDKVYVLLRFFRLGRHGSGGGINSPAALSAGDQVQISLSERYRRPHGVAVIGPVDVNNRCGLESVIEYSTLV